MRAGSLTAAAASGVAVVAVVLSSAGASVRGDPADALGPLDIASASLDQHEHQIVFVARMHTPMPGATALTRFPSGAASTTQRYLCLKIKGSHTKPKLLCPGGKAKHRRLRVGRSSLNGAGHAHKEGSLAARLKRTNDGIRLKFGTDAARLHPGSLSWSVITNWTGPECATPPAAPPSEGNKPPNAKPAAAVTGSCQDSEPDDGDISDRLFPVERVGCRPTGGLHFNGPRSKRRVALTFDDGPSAYTSRVISILDHHHAQGTFFDVGQETSGRSAVMRSAIKHGNELGNHTMHHRFAGVGDMRATSNLIQRATGFRPCLFRPPGGSLGGGVVGAAHAAGMATINWDIDTRDWTTPGFSAIYHTAIHARAGSIVLMHDGGGFRGQTVAALPHIIANLRHRGFKLVTVTTLLGGRYRFREVHH